MFKTQDDFFREVRKLTRVFYRELISVREFVNATIDKLPQCDTSSPRAAELWVLIPDKCREEFESDIRKMVEPDFLHRPFHYGGGRPRTEEEVLRERVMLTARVRSWAIKLVEIFDVGDATP